MSLDLFVYGAAPVSAADLASAVHEIGDVRLVGDLDAAPTSVTVERRLRGDVAYVATLDGPFEVEPEDLPPEVTARAVGVRVMYQFMVEGSSQPAFKIAGRLARSLASICSGVVYDPQQDAVTWPRGSTRTFKPPKAEYVDVVKFSWYVRREDAEPDLTDVLIRQIEAFVPEALPRRFGGYEPLQFKYDDVGLAGFVEQWKAEDLGLFWKARKPSFGGSTFGLAAEAGQPPMPHPVGDISLNFDCRAFEEDRWRRDLVDLFIAVAEMSGAFCAVADIDRQVGYSGGGNLWYGAETQTTWSLAPRREWKGLPPEQPWLLWLGPLYRDYLSLDAETSAGGVGWLLRKSATPLGEPPRSRHASMLQRRRRDGDYHQIPREARMVSTGSPGHGGDRTRAAAVPSGL